MDWCEAVLIYVDERCERDEPRSEPTFPCLSRRRDRGTRRFRVRDWRTGAPAVGRRRGASSRSPRRGPVPTAGTNSYATWCGVCMTSCGTGTEM